MGTKNLSGEIAMEGIAASSHLGGGSKLGDLSKMDGIGDASFSYMDKAGNITGEHIGSLDTSTNLFGDAFSSDNIGGTMSGIGAIAQAAGGIYDAHNRKKYQDKVFGMEEKRVAREIARQDKQQAAYERVFG